MNVYQYSTIKKRNTLEPGIVELLTFLTFPDKTPEAGNCDPFFIFIPNINIFYAAALIWPTRIEGMQAKSVLKKLKTKSFAASVDREEVWNGAELLGWELRELIDFIIPVLEENKEELELTV